MREGYFFIRNLSKSKTDASIKNIITVMKLGPKFLIISTCENPFWVIYSGKKLSSFSSSKVFAGRVASINFSVGIILKEAIYYRILKNS